MFMYFNFSDSSILMWKWFVSGLRVPLPNSTFYIFGIQIDHTMADCKNYHWMNQWSGTLVNVDNIFTVMNFVDDCDNPRELSCFFFWKLKTLRLKNKKFSIKLLILLPNWASLSRGSTSKPFPRLFRTPHFSEIENFDFVMISFETFLTCVQHVSKKSEHGCCLAGSGSSSAPSLTSKMPSPEVIIDPFAHK